jgi:acyl-CoA thioesterase-1
MSFMRLTGPSLKELVSKESAPKEPAAKEAAGVCSYGGLRLVRQFATAAFCSLLLSFTTVTDPAGAQTPDPTQLQRQPIQIVALGDSLTAGYGLADSEGFVPRLQAALAAKLAPSGIAVTVANAGVSGDTATDGLARLDWSVPDGTQAVILELGANDMLRGLNPQVTREALDKILQRLTARHIAVMLCGMRAAPNLGADYGKAFEPIYPELAAKYGALLYPFFLDGVAGNLKLVQQDGLHPTAAGVDVIVGRILPDVLRLVDQIHTQHPS